MQNKDIHDNFPDQPLRGRLKLAYDWISEDARYLLDAGCSYGYGTMHFGRKVKKAYGIDPQQDHILAGKMKYSEIEFKACNIEESGFDDNFFDVIVHTDVLEHTQDPVEILNEFYRILAPGGELILTTPHKGLFGLFDPYNYGYHLRKHLPIVYQLIYKSIRLLKEGKVPQSYNQEHLIKHYHYSINDIRKMLRQSEFHNKSEIEKIHRGGLFLEVFTLNFEIFLNLFLKKDISRKIIQPFHYISMKDYFINYGPLAYNIALKIRKARNNK